MEESTKALLRGLAEASLGVGSANDLADRGDPDGARELREDSQRAIRSLMTAASPDDRARIEGLFGPDLPCEEHSWHRLHDTALHLLERDPELSVERLRDRHAAFDARVRDLRAAADAHEGRLLVRYTGPGAPWLPNAIEAMLERGGERLVARFTPPLSWELDLAGNGIRIEFRRSGPEPCVGLIEGVLVQVDLDKAMARSGLAVSLRSRDLGALGRVRADLFAALVEVGWEEMGRA
jgi:hypothetical protein